MKIIENPIEHGDLLNVILVFKGVFFGWSSNLNVLRLRGTYVQPRAWACRGLWRRKRWQCRWDHLAWTSYIQKVVFLNKKHATFFQIV